MPKRTEHRVLQIELKVNFLRNGMSMVKIVLPLLTLNTSGCSEFVECTFRDARKHFHHRIGSILLVHIRESDYVRSVREESSTQEFVYEEYVANNIDKIEQFTEEVAERVCVVRSYAVVDVFYETSLARHPFID